MTPLGGAGGGGGGGGGGDNERVAEKEEREPPSPPLSSPPEMKPSGRSSISPSLAFVVTLSLASVRGRVWVRHRGSPTAAPAAGEQAPLTDGSSWDVVITLSCIIVSVVVLQFDWLSLSLAAPPLQPAEGDRPPSPAPVLPALPREPFVSLEFSGLLFLPALLPGAGRARSLTDRSRDAVRIQGGSSITFFALRFTKKSATGRTGECAG